jgi:hypothetical protein
MAFVCVVVFLLLLSVDLPSTLAGGLFFSTPERDHIHQLIADGHQQEASHLIETRLRKLDKQHQRHSDNDLDWLEEDQLEESQLDKSKSKSKSKPCNCRCEPGKIDFVTSALGSDGGYGRYCGTGYSCKDTSQPGCDKYDECCRAHDLCVAKTGYCDSCNCNINLVNCVRALPTNTTGFKGCNEQKKAREALLDNICLAIKRAPESCGGCSDKKDHPNACRSDSAGSLVVPWLSFVVMLSVLVSVFPFFS